MSCFVLNEIPTERASLSLECARKSAVAKNKQNNHQRSVAKAAYSFQFIFICSVVTSISVVRDDDPPEKKQKYKEEYEKYSVEHTESTVTEPKFKFYLYNDKGELVQEQLSIHDIQHLLLQKTESWLKKSAIGNQEEEEETSDNDLQNLYKPFDNRRKPIKELYTTQKPIRKTTTLRSRPTPAMLAVLNKVQTLGANLPKATTRPLRPELYNIAPFGEIY